MSDKTSSSRSSSKSPNDQVLSQALAIFHKNEEIEEEYLEIQTFSANRGKKTALGLLKLLSAHCDSTFDVDKELEKLAKVPEIMHDDVLLAYPTRRVSCAVVNTPSPCVNKTIGHIEDLETKIEECFQQFEHLLRERFASTIKMEQLEEYVFPRPSDFHAKFIKKDSGDLKHQTETVLAEAIHLIRSLETDRKDAEDALMEQKLRRRLICKKIDSLSFWRLQKLPFVVQKEHENHTSEILELQYQLEQEMQKLKKLKHQVARLEAGIKKLTDDIQFMSIHKPLLEEKLNMESDIVNNIYLERTKALETSQAVNDSLEQIMFQYHLAIRMAKKEREKMAKELKAVEEMLERFQKELKAAEDISKHYSTEAEKVQKNLVRNQEELDTMIHEKDEVVTKVETLATALNELQEVVDLHAQRIKKLEEECENALIEYLDAKKFWDSEIQKLRRELETVLMKTDLLMHDNKALVAENQEAFQGIKDSFKRKGEYDNAIQELLTRKAKNEDILQKLLKDIAHVINIYNATKTRTDEWEQRLMEERKKFMTLEAYFKKLIRDQVGIGLMVKNRMETVMMDQEEEKKNIQEKKDELLQAFAEVEAPFLELVEEAKKVKTIEEEHTEKIQVMEQHKEEIKRKVIEVKTNLAQRRLTIKEAIEAAEEKSVTTANQIEVAKNTIVTLHHKIKHTKAAYEEKMQEKILLDKKLDKMREIFGFAKYKRENAKQMYDLLLNQLKGVELRLEQEKRSIEFMLLSRRETLNKKMIYLRPGKERTKNRALRPRICGGGNLSFMLKEDQDDIISVSRYQCVRLWLIRQI
ncbi:coiled-coil domain-containing protein 178 isoform X2 [Notamacropus eugenii]|uniref:coiled-coil domain-containing protein 178 isoform X2 n=1 Tax=Notamacropus eugenii TaxID=9315 RepID=UPI003B672532